MTDKPVQKLSGEMKYVGESKRFWKYESVAGSAAFNILYVRKGIIGLDPPKEVWIQIKYQSNVVPDPLEYYEAIQPDQHQEWDRFFAEHNGISPASNPGPTGAREISHIETGDDRDGDGER